MKLSTFGFLTGRGLRNLGTHWAMTIACVASLAVCMSLNTMASLVEVNVDSMIGYLGRQNETVVFLDPACDDATAAAVGEQISAISGVTNVSYMSKQDVLNTYESYMEEYAALWDEFENDNPFKANYRVTVADLSQLNRISSQMETIPGVVKVTAPVEMGSIFVQIQEGVTRMGRAFVLVLMVVSVITVGSTIRLSVFARRREIEIMKYVGATNWLVTLPFLMEGLAIGLIAGVVSASSVLGLYYYLISAASGLSGVWEILLGTSLVPVDDVWSTVLTSSVAGGALVGGLGSLFSIRKHLNV
ncbi:permease-like cell division protein FtsX [Faecalibacterium sp. An192]|uniref:cell division protein FtsX n=1 Tax=Faecalibacterium sp. An192 TaxID=1965581 RepID=UPI001FA83935|nr:permease-like cell division protein FtsX [Faecalibacterium sp. An192]